jgi:hypothetical protein
MREALSLIEDYEYNYVIGGPANVEALQHIARGALLL